MPRRERPLDGGDGPLVEFASGSRQLRRKAGNPPYRALADQAHYSISTLSSAASDQRLPTLAVTRRETGRLRYAALQLGYMSGVAYLSALSTYQVLRAFGVD